MEYGSTGNEGLHVLKIPRQSATSGLAPSSHSLFQFCLGEDASLNSILKAFLRLLPEE